MRARLSLAVTLVLLGLLVGGEFVPGGATASATATPPAGWWNSSYQFRRPITVVNAAATPLVNQSVLLHLNFTGTDVEDAVASIRLVNASGAETPSVVLGPVYSGIFLTSTYLLFTVSLPANSTTSYYVYYGSSSTAVPSYRESQTATAFSVGVVTASQSVLSPSSTDLQIAFGAVDSETTMTKVSYTLGSAQTFGPSPISQQQFANDSGLVLAGQPASGFTAAYQALQSGPVQLTRIVLLSADAALTVDAVSNQGTSALGGVQVTSVVGLSGLTSSGASTSAYDQSSRLLYTLNPDARFGVSPSFAPTSFTLGLTPAVLSQASTGSFSGVSNYTLATSAGFTWALGDVQPGDANWVSASWGAAPRGSDLASRLPAAPIVGVVGAQEVQGVANPVARSLWSAGATLTNVAVTSGGLTVPFAVKGAQGVAGASEVNGTYTYTAPASAQQNSHGWVASTSSAGGATSFVSPSSYDFTIGKTVDQLSLHVPSSSGAGTASLSSASAYAYGGAGSRLQVTYRAAYDVLSGNFSSQALFVAADFDTARVNSFNQTILLPVTGSSTTVPASGCSATVSTGSVPANSIYTGYLIGDGTWRTLSIPLPQSLPTTGFNVRIRLCVSSQAGFTGDMSLEVGSAGVVISGPVSQVFSASFGSTGPGVTLNYLPQASPLAQVGVAANLTVGLLLQANSTVGWKDGSTFTGQVVPPTGFVLNTSAFRNVAVIHPPLFTGVLLGSAVAGDADAWTLGSAPGSVSAGPGTALLTSQSQTSVTSATSYTVNLKSQQVSISVLDKNLKGVEGVSVVPYSGKVAVPVQLTTDSQGVAVVQLVPWSFQLNATYQNALVGTTVVQAAVQSSATIPADLYNLTLVVRDSRTGPLAGADLNLTLAKYSFQGTTNRLGRYSFEAVAGSLYSLTVSVGAQTYFTGKISANANNAVVAVTTTFVPQTTQLLIVVLVALVPVGLLVAFYVSRRLKRPQ